MGPSFGTGDALGTKANLPTEFGTPRAEYLATFQSALDHLAAKLRPELILVSAGFDAHRQDPIGSLGLETDDFAQLTRSVLDVAEAYCGGKVVSVLEGGYDLQGAVTYTWITQAMIMVSSNWGWWDVEETIRTGDVVSDLSKPFSYVGFWLARDPVGLRLREASSAQSQRMA